jgi:hypothetical protein
LRDTPAGDCGGWRARSPRRAHARGARALSCCATPDAPCARALPTRLHAFVYRPQVHDAFASAWRAADEVERPPGMDERTWVYRRKAAAEAALKAALGGLGLDAEVGL